MADENPDAFPCAAFGLAGDTYLQSGMSLRDWFAGQAAAQVFGAVMVRGDETPPSYSTMALAAFSLADAMLAARESTR